MAIGGVGYGFTAESYRSILGSNDRIGMAANFALQNNVDVRTICDVEDKALKKGISAVEKAVGKTPRSEKDIRRMLEDKKIDAVFLAPPDHWHTPTDIMSCAGGKHVYVEKPLSRNPAEGEMAIKAVRKYDRVVQMGSQRRSWKLLNEGISKFQNGSMPTGHDGYTIYDMDEQNVEEVKSDVIVDGRNLSSPAASLDNVHIENFLRCIRQGRTPSADAETGHKSTTWVQLGNITQRVGRGLTVDSGTGHIQGDKEASKLWGREYKPGWELAF